MSKTKNVGLMVSLGIMAIAGSAAAQQSPAPERHDISEICDGAECQWEKVVTCDGFIEGINVDSDGRLWMVALAGGSILRVDDDRCVAVGAKQGAPNGAKFLPDGTLIVADRVDGLQTVDTASGKRESLLSAFGPESFRGLNDLTVASDGGIYFTEPYGSHALNESGRVFFLPAGGDGKPEVMADNIAFPNGVALSADGEKVYVAEYAKNRVITIPSQTSTNFYGFPEVFARIEGGRPDGLIVDSSGNLYVAHYGGGAISVYDDKGFKYGTVRLPAAAGLGATNMALHEGYLYLTEALQNDVWRLKVTTSPLDH